MTSSEETGTLVFDQLPLPVVKINRELDFTYANPAALEWLGGDLLEKNLRDLVPEELWGEMEEQLAKRQRGEGGFYDTQFTRPDGQHVPVKIAGIPLVDNQGQHTGSVGILRDMLFDEVSETIHLAIGETRDGPSLLDRVATAVRRVVPFEYFGVSRYSADLHHSMSFHNYIVDDVRVARDVRWWRIPDPFRRELHRCRVERDFAELMARPELATFRNHPTIEKFVARAYKSYLRLPVCVGGRVVAAVMLFHRQPDLYSHKTVETLRKLPLEQSVQMALHHHEVDEQVFRRRLLRQLLTCLQPQELADSLVTELAEHYAWSHVAVFRVDVVAQEFRLVAQHSPSGIQLGADYRQPLDQGVLGCVLKTGRAINIRDTQNPDEAGFTPCVIYDRFRSELCMPIVWDNSRRVRMLLNVEDEKEGAFSDDELHRLAEIVEEIQPAILRLARQFVLASAFESSPDAILVVDALGNIREANPAAVQLLKYPTAAALLQQPFKLLFASEAEAARLASSRPIDDRATRLLAHDGSQLETLVKCTILPEIIGAGQYVTIRDLAPIRHLQQLEAIGQFYYELAAQTATPLSLVKMWLTRLHAAVGESREQYDLAQKALLQLKQVEITHDRMQLYDEEQARRIPTDRTPLDLLVELRLLLQEFPRADSIRIELIGPPSPPVTVNADRAQVAFMFKTILAYLLRHLPPGDEAKIQVRLRVNGRVQVGIAGIAPANGAALDEQDPVARARFQLALGEPLLRMFAANSGATYHGREYVDQQIIFRLDFESAQEARP